MKRSPGNISKSDPSTVPAVDLTEVRIAILIYLYVDIFPPFDAILTQLVVIMCRRFSSPWPSSNLSFQ